MDIGSITRAIEKLDQDRDLITLANGSHTYIEGSTGESKFSNSQNSSVAVPEFGQKF